VVTEALSEHEVKTSWGLVSSQCGWLRTSSPWRSYIL